MKRIITAVIVLVAALGGPLAADAGHGTFTVTATVANANLLAIAGQAYSSAAAACDPAHAANGTDGIWYDITGFEGHAATLTPAGDLSDFDATFWRKNAQGACVGATIAPGTDSNMGEGFIGLTSGTPLGEAVETGTVPANAQYIFVAYFFGLPGGSFTLSIV